MAKTTSKFECTSCGYESLKWLGKCPQCQSWNSLVEVKVDKLDAEKQSFSVSQKTLEVHTLESLQSQLETQKEVRLYPFSSEMLNHFWNQGLVAGSLTLLAGEPGLGKSTLSLQLLRALSGSKTPPSLLYITAEESAFELARRSKRLGIPPQIMVLQANHLEQILDILEKYHLDVIILDSIQTVFSSQVSAVPGSISQVTTVTSQLLAIAKANNISIILIGHVTKDGQIAGPKTLEHLVDSVLFLELAENNQYRTLSFSKHRFGTTSSLLLLKMEEKGLEIVTDPSLALLENLETGPGVVYGMSLDKDLPLVVEIQALVSKPNMAGGFFGRREALGIKTAKLNTILAISEKYLELDLKNCDVYLQVTGLPKSLQDDSLDLPILLAIISSVRNQSVAQILSGDGTGQKSNTKKKYVFAGRLTLSGSLRSATNLELRQGTASKLGFNYNQSLKEGDLNQSLISFWK